MAESIFQQPKWIFLGILLLLSCRGEITEKIVDGDILLIGTLDSIKSYNPCSVTNETEEKIAHLLFPSLLSVISKYEISRLPQEAPAKLTADKSVDGQADNKKFLTLHFKRDAVWSDGTPVTSVDVKFTFQQLSQSVSSRPLGQEKIDSISIIDNFALEFFTPEPELLLKQSERILIIPRAILTTGRNPISGGPFKLQKYNFPERIELVVNPKYFGKKPHLQGVIFQTFSSLKEMLEAFEQGRIDLVFNVPPVWAKKNASEIDLSAASPVRDTKFSRARQTISNGASVAEEKESEEGTLGQDFFRRQIRILRQPPKGIVMLVFNRNDWRFNSEKIIEAFNLTINRQKMIEELFLGYGSPASLSNPTQYPSPSPQMRDPALAGQGEGEGGVDLERAKNLLKEEGWLDINGDRLLEKNGESFEFCLLYPQGNFLFEKTAQMVADDLTLLGISVEIMSEDFPRLILDLKSGRFEGCLFAWRNKSPKDLLDLTSFLTSPNPSLTLPLRGGIEGGVGVVYLYEPLEIFAVDKRFRGINVGEGWNEVDLFDHISELWVPQEEQRYKKF